MRDLVFAMAHSLIAQAKRDYQLVPEHRRPELNVGGVLGRTPAMVAALGNPPRHRALVVDVGCFARDLAYAVEHIGAALDAVPITDHRKNIFGAADESERVRARCAEDGHTSAVRHRAPGEFARDARELAPAPLGRLRVLGREAASGGLPP